MKALVKAAAAPGFVLRDVPVPTIRDDEVLIRVRRAGVCGTDVHIYDWDAWAQGRVKPPIVVGHEFAGEVTQVGSLVTDVREGDRVTAEGHIVDSRCLCRTGNSHVCPFLVIGVDRDGCFAESAMRRPSSRDNISFDIGGIHDPLATRSTALTADIRRNVLVRAAVNQHLRRRHLQAAGASTSSRQISRGSRSGNGRLISFTRAKPARS